MKDLVRLGSTKWNQMTEQEREPYKTQAEIDRIRYERDRLNYECGGVSNRDQELGALQGQMQQKLNSIYTPQIVINYQPGPGAGGPLDQPPAFYQQQLDSLSGQIDQLE
jgi:hypothetical protein